VGRGSFATITGKAFRPRPMDMGRMAWLLFGVCALYVLLAVLLPIAALLLTSFQRFATALLHQAQFTFANYELALALGPVRTALANSLMLGLGVASSAFASSGIELTATMALIQAFTVILALLILFRLTRGMTRLGNVAYGQTDRERN
jgi:ABC-type spermidine/putrescine transport system permease subunit II